MRKISLGLRERLEAKVKVMQRCILIRTGTLVRETERREDKYIKKIAGRCSTYSSSKRGWDSVRAHSRLKVKGN